MRRVFFRLFVFLVASVLQVRIIDAKDYSIPGEDPEDCVQALKRPCSVNTGDQPRMFVWEGNRFELDRFLVAQTFKKPIWNIYQGMAVVEADEPITLHTPFADVLVEKAKVMVHVLDSKVRVLSLGGRGVIVKPKGSFDENFLVPGFQNWYGGIVEGEGEQGVASVIDLQSFAVARSHFFLNHELGYGNELKQLARIVKWAAQVASDMHRDLVERKLASLEDKHQEKIFKKKKQFQYNKHLRRLFLQKLRYDY